ncbi:MAG: SIR2 family protein [Methanogenium sp.]|nr:SIR2 family protein [Methanogenium sp.]
MLNVQDLQDILKIVETGNLNFFVGAGISKGGQAGLPDGSGLVNSIVRDWVSDDDAISKLNLYADNGLLRLEVLMQIGMDTFADRQAVIDPLLSFMGASPNENHYFLALALKKGCNVITTNFDILIEAAYWNLFGTLPPTIITKDQFKNSSSRGSIFKLHGSVGYLKLKANSLGLCDARETIIVSLKQVAQGLDQEKSEVMMKLIRQTPTLFWGYSCMDDFDIFPVFRECKNTRKPFYWSYFQSNTQPQIVSDEEWNKIVSNVFSNQTFENPRRFKITNLLAVLTQNDIIIVGDLSSWIRTMVLKGQNYKTSNEYQDQFENKIKILRNDPKQTGRISHLEKNLIAAKLLVQVGERGDTMDRLFSSVYQSEDLDPNFCLKICTEHTEAVIPIDLEKAWEILCDGFKKSQNNNRKIDVNTLTTAIFTLSNIKRRQKKKDAKEMLNKVLELINDSQMNDMTKHLLHHYNGLIIHQEVAEEVKYVRDDKSLLESLMKKIDQCEKQFQDSSNFFQKDGLIEYYAMSQNALGLLLIEKGNTLKAGGDEVEGNKIFNEAVDTLQNVGIIRAKYGFFRGVGQAYRNVALACQGQGKYNDALEAISKSIHFYSLTKPAPPEGDYCEAIFRQAELYLQLDQPESSLKPLSKWINRKQDKADWHDEARGLKLLFEANLLLKRDSNATDAAERILKIYQDMLSNDENRQVLKNRRFGIENAKENLSFIQDKMPENMIAEYGKVVNQLIEKLQKKL